MQQPKYVSWFGSKSGFKRIIRRGRIRRIGGKRRGGGMEQEELEDEVNDEKKKKKKTDLVD